MHAPFAKADCTACHNPHQSGLPALQLTKGPDACLTCHAALKEKMAAGTTHSPVLALPWENMIWWRLAPNCSTAVAERIYPLVNAAASPVLYESEYQSIKAAYLDMDRRHLDFIAVYHSHPTSAPVPSKTDLERNVSEEVVNLIVSLAESPPLVRGWWLTATEFREAEWEVV